MNQLPIEIEQKLDQLPIIPFDDNEEFQRLLSSDLFTDIFNYYSKNFASDKVKVQSEIYQKISLYLMLTNQSENFIEQADSILYNRPIPNIHDFLFKNYYMGYTSGNIYPYWREKMEEMFAPGSSIKKAVFTGCIGSGKALSDNTIIPTPNGQRKVGDIKVGDYLFSAEGKPTKILNVFPQGKIQTYKMTFSDDTEVICCKNHLWKVCECSKYRTLILSTEQLLQKGLYNSRGIMRFKLPFCKPVEYSEKTYEIPPYTLGVILGDGNMNKNHVNISNIDRDSFIVEKVAKELDSNKYYLKKRNCTGCSHYTIKLKKFKHGDGYIQKVKKLGLNTTSENKFIPREYLEGSIKQRTELLRGLMDTDGCCVLFKGRKKTCTSFSTTSSKLAKDISELVRSLGGRARTSAYDRRGKRGPNHNCNFIEYRVQINLEINPFSLPRKANKFTPSTWTKKIKSITPHKVEDATCFIVDNPDHLFLANDYTITHNSTIARKCLVYALYRVLCLKYPRAVFNVDNDATLASFIFSITLKTVFQTNLMPFILILNSMPCFQRVQRASSFENFDISNPDVPIPFYVDNTNSTICFKNNIIQTVGSQITHQTGFNLFSAFCFTGDTKVHTTSGDITFEELNKRFNGGERFKTICATGIENKKIKTETTEITKVQKTADVQKLIRVFFDDNNYIECTPEHRFATIENGEITYKQAQHLTNTDEIVANKEQCRIKALKVIHLESPTPVYDLTVAGDNHNFAIASIPGQLVFAHNCDEISEKGIENGLETINAIDSRITSRFQGSDYTFFSIVSSAKQKMSPIGEYIKTIPVHDKENVVFSPKLWEVKPDADFQGDGRTFTVLVGNGVIPSRIIDNETELQKIEDGTFFLQNGCEIINPPLVYKQKFEMNIEQAIQDIAGIATGGDDLIFKDLSTLEDESLCPELHFVADLGKHTNLIDVFPQDMFIEGLNGKKRFKRAPNAKRTCHFDLAEASGDSEAGIALMHVEKYYNPDIEQEEKYYVFDFVGWVSSQVRIDLEAIMKLYETFVRDYGIDIEFMTTDAHQGELMKQYFDNHKLARKTGYISVDRYTTQYDNAARLMESGRVKVGKCPYLMEQMRNVGIRNNHVERLTKCRKDMLDAFCGSIEAARLSNLSSSYQYFPFMAGKKAQRAITYNELINPDTESLCEIA
jgi:hypothetical protein